MAKVAVITGSNGLIGQATCRRLAQSGHFAVGDQKGPDGPSHDGSVYSTPRRPAWATAADRDETFNFVSVLATCRWTVCSLMNSRSAMA